MNYFRYFLLLGFFIMFFTASYAQKYIDTVSTFWELKSANDRYFDSVRTARETIGVFDMRGTGWSKYMRWHDGWYPFMTEQGDFTTAKKAKVELLCAQQQESNQLNSAPNPNAIANPIPWTEIGPHKNSYLKQYQSDDWHNQYYDNVAMIRFDAGVGKFDRLVKHPTNPNILFTCNEQGGGLFYSENNGETWKSGGTDKIPNPRVVSICAKPGVDGTWVVGLANGAIYITTDKGSNWKWINASDFVLNLVTPASPHIYQPSSVWMESPLTNREGTRSAYEVEFSDNGGTLYVAGFNGLYWSTNYMSPSRNWYKFNTPPPFQLDPNPPLYQALSFCAIKKVPRNGNTLLFAVAYMDLHNQTFPPLNTPPNSSTRVFYHYMSSDGGVTWQLLSLPSTIMEGHFRRYDFGRSAAVKIDHGPNPDIIYFAMPNDDVHEQSLLAYNLNTLTWSNLSTVLNDNGSATIHWSPHAFSVNKSDLTGKEYWHINNSIYKFIYPSTVPVSSVDNHYSVKFHADTRAVLWQGDGIAWLACDGGIFKSTDGTQTWMPKSEGLNAAESSMEFGVSQKKPYLVGAGYWHSGIQMYNPEDDGGTWHNWILGDGAYGYFDFNNPNFFMSHNQVANPKRLMNGYGSISTSFFSGGKVFSLAGSELQEKLVYTKFNQVRRSLDFGTTSQVLNIAGVSDFMPLIDNQYTRAGKLYVTPSDDNILYIQDLSNIGDDDRIIKVLNAKGGANQYQIIDLSPIGPFAWGASMCIDDRDPHHFWISASHIISDVNDPLYGQKIWEYSNGQFVDVTYSISGHSDFPWYIAILAIERDRETGTLYISTTNGIYYFDTSISEWVKYSTNIPFVRNGIKINHCEGYIYASIYQRGIWKAPLVRPQNVDYSTSIDDSPIEITSLNTVWSNRKNIYKDVVIHTGAKLKITSDVYIYGMQKIVVEPGAILEVNGGRITNGCSDPWHEIQLWGNSSQPQTAGPGGFYQQARLILNNASIENSHNGVTTWKPDDWNKTGGLIQATNSTFRNNKRSVEFRAYNHPETSYFSGCNFIISGAVAGNSNHYSTAMVTAENINGTLFKACTFECTNPALPTIPKGIYTYNARFRVLPGTNSFTYPPPPSSLLPNQFKGLLSGIEALEGTVNNFTVDTALFQNCGTGILASNTKQYEVLRSRFSLSAQPAFGNTAKGLYNVGGTGFKVEENVFVAPLPVNGSHTLWGVVMNGVGGLHNEVYNNHFTGLNTANLALGANWSNKRPELGLKYKCNVQNDDTRDISVGLGARIGIKQGTAILNSTTQQYVYDPAGNTFSLSPLATGHIQNLGSQTIQYVYHKQSLSNYNVKPIYISSGVSTIEANFGLVDRNQFCPSKLPSSVLVQRKPEAQDMFTAEKTKYDDVRYVYDNLLDWGNTPELLQTVEYAWGPDVWDVRDKLLGGSPFLTDEVLYSVAANPAIPQAVQLEVFMANPQCAKNLDFMEHLGSKPDPMPQWMLDILADKADAKTLRDQMENRLAAHGSLWGYAGNEVLKTLHEDSTGTPVDSLLLWHRRKSDRLAVVDLYAGGQEYGLALGLLDSLMESDSLAGFDREELAARQGLYTLLADYKDNGFPYWGLREGDREALRIFAESGTGYAHREAKNILRFYYGYEFKESIDLGKPKMAGVQHPVSGKPVVSQTLKVYPNPSRGQVMFEYRYPSIFVDLYIEVHTSTGVFMEKIRLTGTEGVYVWDCQNCASGTYVYRVVSGNRQLDSGSIQIDK